MAAIVFTRDNLSRDFTRPDIVRWVQSFGGPAYGRKTSENNTFDKVIHFTFINISLNLLDIITREAQLIDI